MATTVQQDWIFGGVDSRSNPTHLPPQRSLRCLNWSPQDNGELELRYGYSTVTMSVVSNLAIHTMEPYRLLDGTKYLIFIQGTALKTLAISDGTVTTPTIKGTAIASSNRWSFYLSNNRLHGGNGTDINKWFDGIAWRDTGLRALTATEVSGVIVSEGLREFTSAEFSSATISFGTGSLATTSKSGYAIYASYFDPTINEMGPCVTSLGRAQVSTASLSVHIAGMPDNSTTHPTWLKVGAMTPDGGSIAHYCTVANGTATNLSRSGSTLTVTEAAHGHATGSVVILSSSGFDGMYGVAAVPDANTFQVTLASASGSNTTSGIVTRVLSAAANATTMDITTNSVDASIQANEDRGVPATALSSINGASPGYQFYAAIYNPNGGGHVGNRIAIGGRLAPTTRCNVRFSGLPDLSGSDSEWVKLLGRTGDGAEVPYPCADSAVNWQTAGNTATSLTLLYCSLDGTVELPTRNGVPVPMDKFCRSGSRVMGNPPNSASVYRSGSELDSITGFFCGRPEQSWAPDDLETFPTAEVVTCIAAMSSDEDLVYETWCYTLNDMAILVELSGQFKWRGPWNVGCAGQRAFCRTPYGAVWLTGDKQLAAMDNTGPVVISEEFEAAELAKIGDAYLSQTELEYYRDAKTGKNHVKINALDSSGNPFHCIFDYRLRDEDESEYGQAYEVQYLGPLSSPHVIRQVRDANGKMRIYAGASNGQIYVLDSGGNDAGNEFTADYISLLYAGPNRPSIPMVKWRGDSNLVVSLSPKLDTQLADFDGLENKTEQVQGGEHDFWFQTKVRFPESKHVFIRAVLTSHSADGDLSLNDPPHVPVESYGRILMVELPVPQGGVRGA